MPETMEKHLLKVHLQYNYALFQAVKELTRHRFTFTQQMLLMAKDVTVIYPHQNLFAVVLLLEFITSFVSLAEGNLQVFLLTDSV